MPSILKVDCVTKNFAGLAALRQVTFDIEEGRVCGLIGPNGAGKTTLLSIIAGSVLPSSGSVIFRGKRIESGKSYQAVRAGIVRTHQIPRPFRSLSVLANVELGIHFGRSSNRDDSSNEAMEILEWVGIAHLAPAAASTLSVGNLKRMELARALATKPSLLLCDEVCSGLTESETASVLGLLRGIQKTGTTILYVEHNLKAIMSLCNPVVVMNHGQKLVEGSPEEVQSHPLVIEAYIGKKAA